MEAKDRYMELASRAANRGITLFTRFLDLNGQKEAVIAAKKAGAGFRLFGGAPGCERQVMAFYGDEEPEDALYPIRCVLIRPRAARFCSLPGHRDILGSLMSLGSDREMLGDLVITENECHVFCLPVMVPQIVDGLTRAGKCELLCEECALPAHAEKKTEEILLQVNSPRADAVVSHLFRLSRSETDALFASGLVLINDAPCLKPEKQLSEGCILSVRGYGRAQYLGLSSLSKKGKQNVKVALYR